MNIPWAPSRQWLGDKFAAETLQDSIGECVICGGGIRHAQPQYSYKKERERPPVCRVCEEFVGNGPNTYNGATGQRGDLRRLRVISALLVALTNEAQSKSLFRGSRKSYE